MTRTCGTPYALVQFRGEPLISIAAHNVHETQFRLVDSSPHVTALFLEPS